MQELEPQLALKLGIGVITLVALVELPPQE